jgi:hypothetical protein
LEKYGLGRMPPPPPYGTLLSVSSTIKEHQILKGQLRKAYA